MFCPAIPRRRGKQSSLLHGLRCPHGELASVSLNITLLGTESIHRIFQRARKTVQRTCSPNKNHLMTYIKRIIFPYNKINSLWNVFVGWRLWPNVGLSYLYVWLCSSRSQERLQNVRSEKLHWISVNTYCEYLSYQKQTHACFPSKNVLFLHFL